MALAQSIDPTSDRPAYKQIADHLRDLIVRGELAPGESLPSERVLMDSYGAARGTVRQAINVLKIEGLIEVEHGRGSFVRPSPPVKRLASDRFARQHRDAGKAAFLVEVEGEGREPAVEMLRLGRAKARADIAQRLGLDEGAPVLIRHRRYLADGQPLELATSYVPWELAEGTAMTHKNSGPGGIYARIEELGHRLHHFTEDVTARMPTPDEAASLRLGSGVPVFQLVRTAYDSDGRPVEVCDTVMAADRYVLSYELPAK
jgi:GntR family transcriptional regulator